MESGNYTCLNTHTNTVHVVEKNTVEVIEGMVCMYQWVCHSLRDISCPVEQQDSPVHNNTQHIYLNTTHSDHNIAYTHVD